MLGRLAAAAPTVAGRHSFRARQGPSPALQSAPRRVGLLSGVTHHRQRARGRVCKRGEHERRPVSVAVRSWKATRFVPEASIACAEEEGDRRSRLQAVAVIVVVVFMVGVVAGADDVLVRKVEPWFLGFTPRRLRCRSLVSQPLGHAGVVPVREVRLPQPAFRPRRRQVVARLLRAALLSRRRPVLDRRTRLSTLLFLLSRRL
mmetsp:Transcript_60395/g.118365  ORF Transcript_60395/g.118365 Transcript_60395/m.118365 type:complete len:203 (+) Transcript_60395:1228-1836(+)